MYLFDSRSGVWNGRCQGDNQKGTQCRVYFFMHHGNGQFMRTHSTVFCRSHCELALQRRVQEIFFGVRTDITTLRGRYEEALELDAAGAVYGLGSDAEPEDLDSDMERALANSLAVSK